METITHPDLFCISLTELETFQSQVAASCTEEETFEQRPTFVGMAGFFSIIRMTKHTSLLKDYFIRSLSL
jgi:hypothetical protein